MLTAIKSQSDHLCSHSHLHGDIHRAVNDISEQDIHEQDDGHSHNDVSIKVIFNASQNYCSNQ